ncbi:MAG: asparagine synthase-related protein [Haloarculaceae archaeon]
MPEICGIVGTDSSTEPLPNELAAPPGERRVDYRADGVSVRVTSHPRFHEDQPATTECGSLLWIHGDPYGVETDEGYEPRTDFSTPDAAYCAELYDEYGMGFLERLNGEFSGLVLDRDHDEVRFFTDRIGSYPLFYGRTDGNGPLLFSSRIQSVGLHPAFSPAFDREYLAEFFGVQKAFGTATPLAGVRKVPPAGVLSVGLDGSVNDRRVYWRPEYRPVERSPEELAETVVETFREVFAERVRDDLEYGVLLSGGSDSRLILGSMTDRGRSPTAFHMSNWRSEEARTAERTAATAGVDFELLERDADYHERLLESVPRFSNYVGVFDEAIASGFADELGSVDVLLSGYLGDTMFGRYPLYLWRPLSPLPLQFERRIGSTAEYVDGYLNRYSPPGAVPAFLDAPDVSEVMGRHVVSEDGHVVHHGVVYPSLRELQLCEYYPLTNQFAWTNTDSVRQITGHWSPFFDDRLIDLHLTIPVRDRIRTDPINHAASELCPSLARIPHATTNVPLDESTRFGPRHLLARAKGKLRQWSKRDRPPAPYLDNGPWMLEDELIRHHDFIGEAIERNRDLIGSLPFLDGDEIDRCYRAHLAGENNWRDLYALVTFLETPLAKRVGDESR